MKKYILTAFGKDRPGIVESITKVLYEHNANIEDSSMSKLSDQFIIMLLFSSRKPINEKDFSIEGIHVDIREVEDEGTKAPSTCNAIVSIYGADKVGIIYKVSELLASKNINITDLRTHKLKDLYVMLVEIELQNTGISLIEKALKELAKELEVDIAIQEICKEVL